MNEVTKIKECNANDTKPSRIVAPQFIYVHVNMWHIYYAYIYAGVCVDACVRECVCVQHIVL